MSQPTSFSKAVADKLGCYVYRLIDPRNGQTFYVGKGTGNRVFEHARDKLAKAELEADESLTNKLETIRAIHGSYLEVIHVIHRHGMTDDVAREVEAALIDAYPEESNIVGGLDSDKRGPRNAKQIIELYEAPSAIFHHKSILINVSRTRDGRRLYDAVRYAWKLNPQRAKGRLILAFDRGLIIGTFIAKEWLEATPENFPGFPIIPDNKRPRWGFYGEEASEEVKKVYLRRRLPDDMRKRGIQAPVLYADP